MKAREIFESWQRSPACHRWASRKTENKVQHLRVTVADFQRDGMLNQDRSGKPGTHPMKWKHLGGCPTGLIPETSPV